MIRCASALSDALFKALESGSKAGLALDLLYLRDLKSVHVPTYIREGLEWMQERLLLRQQEVQINAREPTTPARDEDAGTDDVN